MERPHHFIEEQERIEDSLNKIDPRTAEILRRHLPTNPVRPAEENTPVNKVIKRVPKGAGMFIENTQPKDDQ